MTKEELAAQFYENMVLKPETRELALRESAPEELSDLIEDVGQYDHWREEQVYAALESIQYGTTDCDLEPDVYTCDLDDWTRSTAERTEAVRENTAGGMPENPDQPMMFAQGMEQAEIWQAVCDYLEEIVIVMEPCND